MDQLGTEGRLQGSVGEYVLVGLVGGWVGEWVGYKGFMLELIERF